ncbi:hypothetical protein RchiOBHm_Chr6g0251411 [Rosa chinensis]|uniref:Uncharacterized protein n=2 Tax=Rosa chinensis TaxID=74649 RepID=A0A2P6PKU1_ROSCH|nr:hypothetical protein RchiOBHm_Chr6g0251411 [Rosa chinensis]
MMLRYLEQTTNVFGSWKCFKESYILQPGYGLLNIKPEGFSGINGRRLIEAAKMRAGSYSGEIKRDLSVAIALTR